MEVGPRAKQMCTRVYYQLLRSTCHNYSLQLDSQKKDETTCIGVILVRRLRLVDIQPTRAARNLRHTDRRAVIRRWDTCHFSQQSGFNARSLACCTLRRPRLQSTYHPRLHFRILKHQACAQHSRPGKRTGAALLPLCRAASLAPQHRACAAASRFPVSASWRDQGLCEMPRFHAAATGEESNLCKELRHRVLLDWMSAHAHVRRRPESIRHCRPAYHEFDENRSR